MDRLNHYILSVVILTAPRVSIYADLPSDCDPGGVLSGAGDCCETSTMAGSAGVEGAGDCQACPECGDKDVYNARDICNQAEQNENGNTECYERLTVIGTREDCNIEWHAGNLALCFVGVIGAGVGCVACIVSLPADAGAHLVLCLVACGGSSTTLLACDGCDVKECVADSTTSRDILRMAHCAMGPEMEQCPRAS